MQGAGKRKRRSVAVTVIAQPTDNLAQEHTAHGTAEADHAGKRADRGFRDHVRRQDHYEGGPRLLPEKRKAEDKNRPSD